MSFVAKIESILERRSSSSVNLLMMMMAIIYMYNTYFIYQGTKTLHKPSSWG